MKVYCKLPGGGEFRFEREKKQRKDHSEDVIAVVAMVLIMAFFALVMLS